MRITNFSKRYDEYISPIADTFCYCLMPNHFHVLIRIKSKDELRLLSNHIQKTSEYCSLRFSNFFNSYAKAFNKQEGRKGVLFMRPYKRKKIAGLDYLRQVVLYIHFNPVVAGLCKKPIDWKYSSYRTCLMGSKTMLKRKEVLEIFNDLDNFEYVHKVMPLFEEMI